MEVHRQQLGAARADRGFRGAVYVLQQAAPAPQHVSLNLFQQKHKTHVDNHFSRQPLNPSMLHCNEAMQWIWLPWPCGEY